MSDSGLEKKFRLVLVKIGVGLNRKNIKNLNFVNKQELGAPLSPDTDGIDVLEHLMTCGEFDAYEPEKLREILEHIGRKDLSEIVNKEYVKSSVYKEYLKERKKKDVLSSKNETPGTPFPAVHSHNHVLVQISKTLECLTDTVLTVLDEDQKAQKCVVAMCSEMETLKKLTKTIEKEEPKSKQDEEIKLKQIFKIMEQSPIQKRVMTSTGEKERQRSNSLDSKTRRRVLKTMPGPLYAITPIGPSVLAEYQKRLDHRKAPNSDSNSNTSSGSSITSTDSSEETQNLKGQEIPDSQSTRYVMLRMQSDVLKDKPQQESCPVKVPDSKNDHVYDDPDRPYENFSFLPSTDSKKHHDADDSHGYVNVPLRTLT